MVEVNQGKMAFLGLIIIVIFIINGNYGEILSDCSSDIYPFGGDTVICDNKCIHCNIKCQSKHHCFKSNGKPITVYSAAYNTNIYCTGPSDACLDSKFYIGTAKLPDGYDISHFSRNNYNSFNIFCIGKDKPCSKVSVYVEGIFNYGVNIYAFSKQSFKQSTFACNVFNKTKCDLYCGNDISNCEDGLFTCSDYGECTCHSDGCLKLATINIQSMCHI